MTTPKEGMTLDDLNRKYADEEAGTGTNGADEEEKTAVSDSATAISSDSASDSVSVSVSAEVFALTSPIVDDEAAVASDEAPDGPAGLSGDALASVVESLLFAADKPLNLRQLGDLCGIEDTLVVRAAVSAVEARYQAGVQLHAVAGGFQFRTNAENAPWVQKMLAQKPVKLSRAQLETLAICAYRQPITRPEIDDVRGVDSGGALRSLMYRALVRILGKKEEPGRPMLYGTTREFLEFFNLGDLKDLPTLREFHELSDEHRAQVEALEQKAPPGSFETAAEAEAAVAATRPLSRMEWKPAEEDTTALAEIDRLLDEADQKAKLPSAPPPGAPGAPTSDDGTESK